jgi:hypothetical protein
LPVSRSIPANRFSVLDDLSEWRAPRFTEGAIKAADLV